MLIKEEALTHWLTNFYGYGSWHARFWFIDHEEEGGDAPEEVAGKFTYFQQTHPDNHPALCDLRALFRSTSFSVKGPRADLFTNLHDYRFNSHAVQHGEWKNLIAFVHAYKGEPLPDLLEYQKHALALAAARSEALLRLYPLPAHSHAWYYSWLELHNLGFLKSRALYQEHVYATRMRTLLTNLRDHTPEVVVMYGMETIDKLKKSVQDFFPGVKFKMIKAVKNEIPQHHRADINGTKLIITSQIPTLKHNRIETGFDWQAFGKLVSER